MKSIFSLFILISVISCSNVEDGFVLEGELKSNYSGYLYLEYEEKIDSCLLKDNKFLFKGILSKSPSPGNFSLKTKTSAMEKDFYLENSKMKIELSLKEKKIKEFDVVFFKIEKLTGNKTFLIQKDLDKFVELHHSDKDFSEKLHQKALKIITADPQSKYSTSLLLDLSLQEKLSKEKLKELFLKIDKRSQDSQTIQILESRIFPEKFAQIDGIVPEFELPQRDNSKFNLSSLDGKYYLIDFWLAGALLAGKKFQT